MTGSALRWTLVYTGCVSKGRGSGRGGAGFAGIGEAGDFSGGSKSMAGAMFSTLFTKIRISTVPKT